MNASPNYPRRLLIAAALCGGAYFWGTPYILLGDINPGTCDYFGLQGHRTFSAAYEDCSEVKIFPLSYPLLGADNGQNDYDPSKVWTNHR